MSSMTLALQDQTAFAQMADAAPVLIWVSGPDKGCTWFNKPWLLFVGRTMAEEIGTGWTQNVHADDLNGCVATYSDAFAQQCPFTMAYRLKRYDGVYRWVLDHGVPRLNADGTLAGYVGSCVDITEQKVAEAALRLRESA